MYALLLVFLVSVPSVCSFHGAKCVSVIVLLFVCLKVNRWSMLRQVAFAMGIENINVFYTICVFESLVGGSCLQASAKGVFEPLQIVLGNWVSKSCQ